MQRKKVKFDHSFYSIVANGGMSSPTVGEGRFLPALIIDVEGDRDVIDLIRSHREVLPGDTELQWALPDSFFSPKSVFLNLSFLKPMRVQFGIEFILRSQYSLVDGIIQSRGFYLMTGKAKDKVSKLIDESILIEVPDMDFDLRWNEMLFETVKKRYLEWGHRKKDARELAREHIKSMRSVWNLRR